MESFGPFVSAGIEGRRPEDLDFRMRVVRGYLKGFRPKQEREE